MSITGRDREWIVDPTNRGNSQATRLAHQERASVR